MDYDEMLAHRKTIMAAGRVRMTDEEPGNAPGRVIEDSETTHDILYAAGGDDCAVMVLVAWTRSYLRPEYVEDLVPVERTT